MFFVDKYANILNCGPAVIDELNDEFVDYQMLPDGCVPVDDEEGSSTRLDKIWAVLAGVKHADGREWLPKLSQVTKLYWQFHIQMLRKRGSLVWSDKTKLTSGHL